MTTPLTARTDLADVEPYVSPQVRGWTGVQLNTNESPYPPPPGVLDEVVRAVKTLPLNRYPDREAAGLVDALAAYAGWPREGIWLANGSNEVFLHLFLAFGGPGRTALVFQPTYSLHSLIPRIAGTRVIERSRAADLTVDLDDARHAIDEHRPEVVILCSPNNPTGLCEEITTVEAIADAAPGLVVVDEAYAEFASGEESVRPLLVSRPNLALTKTFSKAWRLAGVRIGYMLAAPALIAEMERVRLPYHLSAITQSCGRAALAHMEETLALARAVASERDRIVAALREMGVVTFPSRANFVLFRVDDAQTVWQELMDRGVLIRNYHGVPGLDGCLRVTAGLPEETDAFLEAIEEVLNG